MTNKIKLISLGLILALVITSCTVDGFEIPVDTTPGTGITSNNADTSGETGGKKEEPKLTDEQALFLAQNITPFKLCEKVRKEDGHGNQWFDECKEEYIKFTREEVDNDQEEIEIPVFNPNFNAELLKPVAFNDLEKYKDISITSFNLDVKYSQVAAGDALIDMSNRTYNYVIKCNYDGKIYETKCMLTAELMRYNVVKLQIKINDNKFIELNPGLKYIWTPAGLDK